MNNIVVGIDYSMSSPGICVHQGSDWDFKNCKFYYFTKTKKCQIKTDQFIGDEIPIHSKNDIDRYENYSDWVINHLLKYDVKAIGMEGYSYGSKGSLLFSIAENTYSLKRKLYVHSTLPFPEIYSPGTIKKFATGKGNAKKEMMWESFLNETKFDITKIINSNPTKNPISDLVDAYWICKLTFIDKQ